MGINERADQIAAQERRERAARAEIAHNRYVPTGPSKEELNRRKIRQLLQQFAHWARRNNVPTNTKRGWFGPKGWIMERSTATMGSYVETTYNVHLIVYESGEIEYTKHGGAPKYRRVATDNYLSSLSVERVEEMIAEYVARSGKRW